MTNPKQSIQYYQIEADDWERVDSEIINETSVSLTVNGRFWMSLLCTPTDLESLAIGFLFNEGLIDGFDEVASVRLCPTGNNVDIWLYHSLETPLVWRRTSGCTGGITSVDSKVASFTKAAHTPQVKIRGNGSTLTLKQVGDLISLLFENQDLYRSTGGVHTSALSDGQQIVVVTEDIGRHNTLDKIAGRCLLEGIDLPRRILLTTGRISSDMMQKAARLGACVVISRTSPSSLAILMAERWGISLVGYARRRSFRVYTHPERFLLPEGSIPLPHKRIVYNPPGSPM